ncbi:hypothetical protein HOG21_03430 [bacterium]|nr:hypothetical protein [bacterium]
MNTGKATAPHHSAVAQAINDQITIVIEIIQLSLNKKNKLFVNIYVNQVINIIASNVKYCFFIY